MIFIPDEGWEAAAELWTDERAGSLLAAKSDRTVSGCRGAVGDDGDAQVGRAGGLPVAHPIRSGGDGIGHLG